MSGISISLPHNVDDCIMKDGSKPTKYKFDDSSKSSNVLNQ